MIDHLFNAEGFHFVETLLNLASDEVLQDTAELLAYVIRQFWGFPKQGYYISFLMEDAYYMERVGEELSQFLQCLSDAQVQAAYGRNDLTEAEFRHRRHDYFILTGQPSSDIIAECEITSCSAYRWLVIPPTNPH